MADNPQTQSGTGGASTPLPWDPSSMFGALPPGAVTDAQYLADAAALRQQTQSQYQTILGQLGYVDPLTGAFIPGSVEQQADIDQNVLNQGMQQADLAVDQNAQNSGTLFSGIRGVQRSQAEMPYLQQIGQKQFDTTNSLASLYQQAQDLIGGYNAQNMQLLSDAATRAAAAAQANPPIAAPPAVDSTPPPPSPPAPTVDNGTESILPDHPVLQDAGAIAYAKGGEISHPTLAIMGENARPGNRASHEVVVPRHGLTKEENQVLDHLSQAAQVRQAALSRLSGQHPAMGRALHAMGGHNEQAAQIWEAHHAAAMRGDAPTPAWVSNTLSGEIHNAEGNGVPQVHIHMQPHILPRRPVAPNINELALQIGHAALARAGNPLLHPPAVPPGGFVRTPPPVEPASIPDAINQLPPSPVVQAVHAIQPPTPAPVMGPGIAS